MPVITGRVLQVARPSRSYTKVQQAFTEDVSVSNAAHRIGCYLLGHMDGFRVTNQLIAAKTGNSLRTVVTALAELEQRGYLVRVAVVVGGRRKGTDFYVSGDVLTPAQRASLAGGDGANSARGDGAEFARQKNKISSRDQINPSGGAASPPAVRDEPSPEEPMPPAAQPMLELDLPAPARKAKTPRPPGAQDVVAAFVDSYRRNHGDQDPSKRDTNRIGRDARDLLASGKATIEELTAAAVGTGATPFAALGVQLNIVRERKAGTGRKSPIVKGYVAAMVDNPAFQESRDEHAAWRASLHTDRDAARRAAADPFWRAELIREDPSLAAVFAQVEAA